jgi:hypothetical protein
MLQCLADVSVEILNAMRIDDNKRDLEEQFRSREVGHHRYFIHPYKRANDEWGSMVQFLKVAIFSQLHRFHSLS